MKNFAGWAATSVALGLIGTMTAQGASAPAPIPPFPDEGTTFNAWVADQVSYDDNIYRQPAGAAISTVVSPNATRGDQFNDLAVGSMGQVVAARQVFRATARVDDNRFLHNDALNNTGYGFSGAWDFSLGSSLTGTMGGDVGRYLANFSEIRFNGKDLVRTSDYYVDGRYQVGPHWALLGNFVASTADQGAPSLEYNNFKSKLVMGGVEYATEVDDTFAFKYTYYDGRYPDNRSFGGVFYSSDYVEHFPQFWVKYGLTDKTSFSGNIGHLKRQYENAITGSYTGVIWRVKLDWQATEKLSFTARSWHEVHSYTVSAADYFISTGGSISPNWALTSKINLSLVVTYEKDNYIENSTSVNEGGERHDRDLAEQLNLSYALRERLFVNMFVRRENRHSNFIADGLPLFTFTDDLANVSVTYKFF